jgi:hypothetical protein
VPGHATGTAVQVNLHINTHVIDHSNQQLQDEQAGRQITALVREFASPAQVSAPGALAARLSLQSGSQAAHPGLFSRPRDLQGHVLLVMEFLYKTLDQFK